jgi:hypothetical protein
MDSLERESDRDLHYSAVLCLSERDLDAFKSRILDGLKEQLAFADETANEEALCCYTIDFFSLKK